MVRQHPRIREPVARVTFSTAPTCIDVNQFTRSAERLDVIVGFNSGDLIWIDPVSLRYSRINKGGTLSASGVRQVRWLPRSESLFLSAHMDGSVFVMDRDREDTAASSQRPDPDARWDYNRSLFVSHPQDVLGEEGAATGGWWPSKGKDGASGQMNPVSYWRVSKRAVTDFAFSPTNTQVAITAEDGILRIVDVDSETYVAPLTQPRPLLRLLLWWLYVCSLVARRPPRADRRSGRPTDALGAPRGAHRRTRAGSPLVCHRCGV